MKTYRLTTRSFYNHVRHLGHPTRIESTVENGKIKVEGHEFTFVDEAVSDGQTVLFWMGNWGYCVIKSEYEEYWNNKHKEQEQRKEQKKQLENLEREKANNFYNSLNFPCKFHVNIKDVLSGLTAHSNGDSAKKNTVYHLILDEDFKSGRLKRKKGEFLCSQPKSVSNWAGVRHEQTWHIDGDGNNYVPAINCKSCLKILKKYLN